MGSAKKLLATGRFKKGDRVQQTEAWVEYVSAARHGTSMRRIGTVVGFSRNKRYIRVVMNGQKTPSSWHPDFWEAAYPIQPKPRQLKPIHFGDECVINEDELDKAKLVLSAPYGVVLEPKQTPAPKSGWLDRFIGFLLGISWSNFISLTKSDSRK